MRKIRLFIIAFVFVCGFQSAHAQPSTSAPIPSRDAADVYSLFSDFYTTQGDVPVPLTYGGTTPVTKEIISGTTDSVFRSSGESHGVFTTGWQGQKKGYIHVDVYSVSGGAFSFGVGIDYAALSIWPVSSFVWPTLVAGVWKGIDVPVVDFVKNGLNDAANIQNIKFTGDGTYYIDNIYAWGEKEVYIEPANLPVAPTPVHAAAEVKSVFSDSYTNSQEGFKPQPYGGIVAKIQPYATALEDSVVRLTGLDSCFVHIPVWRIADKSFIHIDVYYVSGGDGSFSFGLSNAYNQNETKYITYSWPYTIESQWVGMDIPTAKFTEAGVDVDDIAAIHFQGSGNFYVDNLYAHNVLATSIEQVSLAAQPKIVTTNGLITAAFEGEAAAVKLYNVTGLLVDQASAVSSYSKSVGSGLYLLVVDGKPYKVLVK